MPDNMRDSFLDEVQACIDRHAMLAKGERAVVGVSGGADSVALLHVLHRLGYAVIAAHLNHLTRGEDSDADEQLAHDHAAALQAPFVSESQDVASDARDKGLSFEEAARAARYAFFARVAAAHTATAAATAHHADDQAETVIMRILRGAGPDGLAGIPQVRMQDGLRIVRPLLGMHRAGIRAWLAANRLAWREDASNGDLSLPRNRVRHTLLPLLEREYNPRAREALIRLAEAQRIDNGFWEKHTAQVLPGGEIDPGAFAQLHEAVRRRVILRLARERGIEITWERITEASAFIASARTGAYCDLAGGWSLYRARDRVLLCPPAAGHATHPPVLLQVPGTAAFAGRIFSARLCDAPPAADLRAWCSPMRQVFDADKAVPPLAIRARQPGDVIAPLGLHGEKKLSDLFIDKGVPAPLRDDVPVILSGETIIWAAGVAPAQCAAVAPATTRYLIIEARDAAL